MPFIALVSILSVFCQGARASSDQPHMPAPLIGYWSFDETDRDSPTTVLDASGNGLHATLVTDPVSDAALKSGICGQSIHASDTSAAWVQLPESELLDLQPPFTIAAWVKPRSSEVMEIVCKKWDSDGRGFRLRSDSGMLLYEFGNAKKTFETVKAQDRRLSEDKWSHVAVTHTADRVSLYINGINVARMSPKLTSLDHVRNACIIGNYVGNKEAGYQFVGIIDEVVIVGRALSSEAVLDLAVATHEQ